MRCWPWIVLLLGFTVPLEALAQASPEDPFAPCEARLREAPDLWESARCFYEVALRGKLWEEAAHRLDTLGNLHPELPWLRLAAAYVEEERDPERATGKYEEAVVAFEAQGHAEGEVRARCAFAFWLSTRGKIREAGEELDAAVRRGEASGQPALLAEALTFQARHLLELETDLELPYRLARRAENALFPDGSPLQQALCLELLARLSRDLGLSDQAMGYNRRLEPLARSLGRSDLEAQAQFGIGFLQFHELDRAYHPSGLAQAAAQMRKALATAEATGDPLLQSKAHSVLLHLSAPEEAEEHAKRCLALAQGRNDVLTSYCLRALARLKAETDPKAALRYLEESREAAVRSDDLPSLAWTWNERMSWSWRFRSREQASADTLAALGAVEELRDRQLEQDKRAGFFSRWLTPYYVASGYFLSSYRRSGDPADLDQAFAITESMRARVLRDLLASSRAPDRPASRHDLETALAPGEALFSFQIAPRQDFYGFAGGSWLLVSTRSGTRVYLLPESVDRAGMETTVSALLGLVDRRDGGEADLATVLYGQLLARALAELPAEVNRLVIVPDGVLHLLPFPLLRPRWEGPLLTDRFQVSVVPSATLWSRWRRQGHPSARAALVLADPARSREGPASQAWRQEEGRLPWAREEGRHVARRCGTGSLLRQGADAGEAFLKKQDLTRFGILHLATHAVADEARPEDSAVLLSPDAPGEDGRLRVDEIAKLRLHGGLVALSSCRGAAGALVGGEGVMSLSRVFFAAGANAVVGSLWPVRDDDAEAFFDVFYDRLAEGGTAAAAFSAAQRDRIRASAPTQAWAGFVLYGNGGWRLPPAPPSGAWKRAALLGGAALFALLIGYALLRRRTASPRATAG